MYPLFESIRISDGIPQNLSWHQQRIDRSFLRHYCSPSNFKLDEILCVPDQYLQGVVKARLKYNVHDYAITFGHYHRKNIYTIKSVATRSLCYYLKYTDRSKIDFYYNQRGLCNDVLLIAEGGLVTDTSFANIIFYDGKKWVTPGTPLLEGTERAKLIFEGTVHSMVIFEKCLKKFKGFQLVNAMMPFNESEIIPMNRIIY